MSARSVLPESVSVSRTAAQSSPAPLRPRIIQGGMGVGVSGWRLARAVSRAGQLGVVSGTAIEVVLARRLQDGDPGGNMRRALAAFPDSRITAWILEAYFIAGGRAAGQKYRPVPRHTLASATRLVELTVAAAFCEVWLAKEGHSGTVGLNVLRKIELPLPATVYGAILAGVDAVLVGAGNPGEIPALVTGLARHEDVTLDVRVMGARSSDGFGRMPFSPKAVLPQAAAPGPRPQVLAVVASTDMARGLAHDPATRPDGFVVEGEIAGGHNAPPRGPHREDEYGQPIYDERDEVDLPAILALGLPVWLAGGYGTPEGLRAAVAMGATGVQVGTTFAFCDESGFTPGLKAQVRALAGTGDLAVRSDWRASPTGFPFRVAQVPGTLSDPSVSSVRTSVCDLGVLRTAYLSPKGEVDFRCPAEPAAAYLRKGGREINRGGRVCLCNALLASAGLGQVRSGGVVEPALVTSGTDLSGVVALTESGADRTYTATDVVRYLLTGAA